MSSGTRKEPIKPVAPVMNTRMLAPQFHRLSFGSLQKCLPIPQRRWLRWNAADFEGEEGAPAPCHCLQSVSKAMPFLSIRSCFPAKSQAPAQPQLALLED